MALATQTVQCRQCGIWGDDSMPTVRDDQCGYCSAYPALVWADPGYVKEGANTSLHMAFASYDGARRTVAEGFEIQPGELVAHVYDLFSEYGTPTVSPQGRCLTWEHVTENGDYHRDTVLLNG